MMRESDAAGDVECSVLWMTETGNVTFNRMLNALGLKKLGVNFMMRKMQNEPQRAISMFPVCLPHHNRQQLGSFLEIEIKQFL